MCRGTSKGRKKATKVEFVVANEGFRPSPDDDDGPLGALRAPHACPTPPRRCYGARKRHAAPTGALVYSYAPTAPSSVGGPAWLSTEVGMMMGEGNKLCIRADTAS